MSPAVISSLTAESMRKPSKLTHSHPELESLILVIIWPLKETNREILIVYNSASKEWSFLRKL